MGGEGLVEEGYGSYIEFLTHNYLCLVNVLGSIGPFQLLLFGSDEGQSGFLLFFLCYGDFMVDP